jgi:hypothetical protein
MQNHSPSTAVDDRRKRADTHFKAREILKADAVQAVQDYRAAHDAVVERTRRLRAERLAREGRARR